MRYRLMATYQGSPFEAGIGPADGDIVLFAACPPPEELGFEPATGHWRKQLRFGDVQAVWESRPVGTFRGERCMVLDDLGDRLHIGYLGHDGLKAEQLGYWQVDRGVFELVAPRTEVTEILEERTEYRRPASPARPDSGAYPASPARPDSGAYPIQHSAPGYSGPGYPPPAGPGYTRQPDQASGQYPSPGYGQADPLAGGLQGPPAGYLPVPDDSTGVTLPVTAEAPLPLEAAALRAASASRRPGQTAARRTTPPDSPGAPASQPPLQAPFQAPVLPAPTGLAGASETAAGQAAAQARQSRSTRQRMATELLFAELAGLAGIPADSYAVGEDVEGALCLVRTGDGFEVFHSAGGARHELQVFASEEAACFYLFGVLAAEAVRNGSLVRVPAGLAAPRSQPG